MTEVLHVDIGHGVQVIRETCYPNNTHKRRDIEQEDIVPIPMEIKDYSDHYYVRVKYAVWPKIYGEHLPIPFPTLTSAWDFAKHNLSTTTPVTRVYSPDGDLCWVFIYDIYKEKK